MASQSVSQPAEVKPVDSLEKSTGDDFQKLLEKDFRARSEVQRNDIRAAIELLTRETQSSDEKVSSNAVRQILSEISKIDKKITGQLNEVMHDPIFQSLEGAWRGLHYLVNNTETDRMLQLRFLNISKKELGDVLEEYEGTAWDQSPIFKKVYTSEYSMLGGHPYGCLVGDYYFDNSPADVSLLGNLSNICASAHAPFIAGAAPSLFGMDSWQELMNPRDLEKKIDPNKDPSFIQWNSLRESEDSRYLALTLPRVLARLPYGAETKPVAAFDFEEEVKESHHNRYCWMNAAYAMAVNINRSFKLYGWCTRIRGVQSGGTVRNLPIHSFPTDDGSKAMKCPTEIAIDQRRENELGKLGLMPISHRKNTDVAAFIGAQVLQKPKKFYDNDASANANLSARLPYLFAVSRFAHYLKKMTYDMIGEFRERADLEQFLQSWITNYIDLNPNFSSQETKAQKPLRAAEVTVAEVPGNPGVYDANFYLRPHYQLDGVNMKLSLVARLPSQKSAGG